MNDKHICPACKGSGVLPPPEVKSGQRQANLQLPQTIWKLRDEGYSCKQIQDILQLRSINQVYRYTRNK